MHQAMPNLTQSDGLIPQAELGAEYVGKSGNAYKYMKAAGTIAAYSLCTFQNDFDAEEGTTTTSGAKPTGAGVAQFAIGDLEYFWLPIGPFGPYREDGYTPFKVNAALDCATSVKLYTTATDGVVDDSATDLVAGLCLTETITTARAANCIAVQRLVTNCQD